MNARELTRFENLYQPEPNSGCWLWRGTGLKAGYGTFKQQGVAKLAHRLAFEHFIGRASTVVRHTCDTPSCVNPDHLRTGTHQDNADDMVRRGRSLKGAKNPSQQHPERLKRGDDHGLRRHPECVSRGAKHSTIMKTRAARGETHGHSKLTEVSVREIREKRARGATLAVLAAEFGVSFSLIGMIARRDIWRHV